jgi:hypothetical protein
LKIYPGINNAIAFYQQGVNDQNIFNGPITASGGITGSISNAITASYSITSSNTISASYSITASYVPNLYPVTNVASASWASSSISAISASYFSGSAITASNYYSNNISLIDQGRPVNSYGTASANMFVSASEEDGTSDALYFVPGAGTGRIQMGTPSSQFYALDLTNTQNITGFAGTFTAAAIQGPSDGVTLFYNSSGDSEYGVGSYGFQPNIGGTYPVLFDRVNGADSGSAIGYVFRTNTAITSSGGKFMIWENGVNGAKLLTVLSNGNFGINGVTNPTNSLDVKGNISCSVITASLFNNNGYNVPIMQAGSASVSGTSQIITFNKVMPSKNYVVSLTGEAAITTPSATGKTIGGFTASYATYTGNLDWVAMSATQ